MTRAVAYLLALPVMLLLAWVVSSPFPGLVLVDMVFAYSAVVTGWLLACAAAALYALFRRSVQ